jgi:CCR4-NOT transcriptional regulation complex NOT5 subunit
LTKINAKDLIEEEDSVQIEAQRIKKNKIKEWADGKKDMIEKIKKVEGLNSICTLVENYPSKFKEFIEELVGCDDEG